MRSQKRISLFNGFTESPNLLVVLKLCLDLMFKLVCYFLVYKFYVYVKPKFCRKPVVHKNISASDTEESEGATEGCEQEKGQGDDEKNQKAKERTGPKEKVSPELVDNLDKDDEFVKATEKLLAIISARKTYSGSQKIQDLHTRLIRSK